MVAHGIFSEVTKWVNTMPEFWRFVAEAILTGLFGLNVVLLTSIIRRVGVVEENQSKANEKLDSELLSVRTNYTDRIAEVNNNLFVVKEQLLRELSEIKISIAKLQTYNERREKDAKSASQN